MRSRALFLMSMLLILLPASSPFAADKESSPRTITADDILSLESASQFDISPDGKLAVWVRTKPVKSKNARSRNIMMSSLADTFTIEITRGFRNDSSPKFSPAGGKVAFISSKGKTKSQIYIYDIRGGEPEKLTNSKTGVRGFSWLNEDKIIFASREDSTLLEKKRKRSKDDAIVVADQDHYYPVRLFLMTIKDKKVKRLTTNSGRITEFDISPDGKWVVTNENQDINYSYDNRVPPRQFLMNLESMERREIFTEPHDDPYDFKWADDGSGFYFRKDHSSDPTDTYVSINHIYFYDLSSGKPARVTQWEKGCGHAYLITRGGIIAALSDGTRDRIAVFSKKAGKFTRKFISSPTNKQMALYASKKDGNVIIYAVANASSIPEVMAAEISEGAITGERKLIKLNESLKNINLSKREIISWRGARGEKVEGILYYPPGYEEGKRYPLIALIHGGPTGVDRDYFSERWSNYPHLLASRGSFVLKVNYHGSGNYGLKWMESIKGRYYELEVPDILKGIDYVIKRGLADENKLGLIGWSNGSILAIESCIRSNRFKALCAGAGDVNWTSDYGNCAFGAAFDNAYFGGPPWKRLRDYIKKSPLFKMEKMKTPTLILFGTDDTNVPTEQGWQHFRAMQQIGKVPVRFILFPGATHGIRKLSHQRRKIEEELAWFDKYLFGREKEKNEAFDTDSRLAYELKKVRAKKSIGFYGEAFKHVIVPEIVRESGMLVSRFEITRAQYQAFDIDADYPPGTGNHPVNNITIEQARGYCAWLSRKTGRNFRLPNVSEMEKLLKLAKSNLIHENNLEYWSGYSPTPDEMKMLEEKIEELERSRLLIEEVGSFKPVGSACIYDLGGNVAEWAEEDDGTGRIMGLSAITSRDGRIPYQPPPLRYVGFRIVEEASKEPAH